MATVDTSDPSTQSRHKSGRVQPKPAMRFHLLDARYIPVVAVAVVLLVWEGLVRSGLVHSPYYPATSSVFAALYQQVRSQEFWHATEQTMEGWLVGFVGGFLAGVVVGIILGISAPLLRSVRLIVDVLRPIPPVAVLPLAVLLCGVGLELKAWLVAIGAFFPVLIQTIYGTREVDPILLDTARCYGFSRRAIARYVTTPSALPYVMTGARFAATASLLVVLAVELVVGSSGGLGYEINLAQNAGKIPAMYALVLATGIVGLLISWLFRAIENRSLHWHGLHRQDGGSR